MARLHPTICVGLSAELNFDAVYPALAYGNLYILKREVGCCQPSITCNKVNVFSHNIREKYTSLCWIG